MSDPLRSDPLGSSDKLVEADREARIEQLLLSGLDHYFAGEYEQAINVWTRVVFLERSNDRARAYIERARSALAEHHRESEELLHRGVAAFDRGETDAARVLLSRAVEQGGTRDLALVFLERLNRLGSAAPAHEPLKTPPERRPGVVKRQEIVEARSRSRGWWLLAIATMLTAIVAGAVLSGLPVMSWVTDLPVVPPRDQLRPAEDPLPVARSSEAVLARARALQAGGHLKDALRMLDRIGIADPLRADADALRADMQRQLLDASRPQTPVTLQPPETRP